MFCPDNVYSLQKPSFQKRTTYNTKKVCHVHFFNYICHVPLFNSLPFYFYFNLHRACVYSTFITPLKILHPQSRRSAKLVLQSSELGLPRPLTRTRVYAPPPLLVPGEGHTSWRVREWESPNSDDGTYIVVLYLYTGCGR